MTRSAADLLTARFVAQEYRRMAHFIDKETADPKLRGMPLTQRILRQYAAIARRAAIIEELDTDPPTRPCGICGGDEVCI